MKRIAMYLLPLGVMAGAAYAQDVEVVEMPMPAVVDVNADGAYSLGELQATWPELTEADFVMLDTDADGVLSAAEVDDAWTQQVILVMPERLPEMTTPEDTVGSTILEERRNED